MTPRTPRTTAPATMITSSPTGADSQTNDDPSRRRRRRCDKPGGIARSPTPRQPRVTLAAPGSDGTATGSPTAEETRTTPASSARAKASRAFEAVVAHDVSSYADYDPVIVALLAERRLHLALVLSDTALLFRYFNKNRFASDVAEKMLVNHLRWRVRNNIHAVSRDSLSQKAREYATSGFLRYFGQDKLGRPCGVLNLGKYDATAGKRFIEDLREYLIYALEVGRKCVYAVNNQPTESELKALREEELANGEVDQRDFEPLMWRVPLNSADGSRMFIAHLSVIVDLDGIGMANLNYELIPLLYDLFHSQYPQIFGTVYVLNYGWIHGGIWSIAKTALPADSTKKLIFLKKDELNDHFDLAALPRELGGQAEASVDELSANIFSVYESEPSPENPNNYPNSDFDVVLSMIKEAESRFLDEREDEEWFDAVETISTAPVRSAADLQSILRSPHPQYPPLKRLSSLPGLSQATTPAVAFTDAVRRHFPTSAVPESDSTSKRHNSAPGTKFSRSLNSINRSNRPSHLALSQHLADNTVQPPTPSRLSARGSRASLRIATDSGSLLGPGMGERTQLAASQMLSGALYAATLPWVASVAAARRVIYITTFPVLAVAKYFLESERQGRRDKKARSSTRRRGSTASSKTGFLRPRWLGGREVASGTPHGSDGDSDDSDDDDSEADSPIDMVVRTSVTRRGVAGGGEPVSPGSALRRRRKRYAELAAMALAGSVWVFLGVQVGRFVVADAEAVRRRRERRTQVMAELRRLLAEAASMWEGFAGRMWLESAEPPW
ncbi:hypothetical protein DFJ73DRAFT_21494 [Zopfochytrium polystomum]|nr:hypothetical protein DFJ73DRAFT_21494 [Zopfochytrium polystomum]